MSLFFKKKGHFNSFSPKCKVRRMQFEETRVLQIWYFSVEVHCNVFLLLYGS